MALDTMRKLAEAVLREIKVLGRGQSMNDDDGADVLRIAQTLHDEWSADARMFFTVAFSEFTITPELQPHTIGPAGATWTAPRPLYIPAAKVVPVDQTIEIDMDIWDRRRWLAEPYKDLEADYPAALNLEPTFTGGRASINLWPVPLTAATVKLGIPQPITALLSLDTDISLPPGYEVMWLYNLAERCLRPFNKPYDPKLTDDARRTRDLVASVNDEGLAPLGVDIAFTDGRTGSFRWETGDYR